MNKKFGLSTLAVIAAVTLVALPGLALAGQGEGKGEGKGSSTQGSSKSNPDGGGVDKPYDADGQAAGSQGPDYHDGNNGCGQDKRSGEPREAGTERPGWDDNNGWCGKPPFAENEAQSQSKSKMGGSRLGGGGGGENEKRGAVLGGGGKKLSGGSTEQLFGSAGFGNSPTVPTLVLGATFTRAQAPNSTAVLAAGAIREAPKSTAVLGATFERGQRLAATGFGAKAIVALGLIMISGGLLLSTAGRRTTDQI